VSAQDGQMALVLYAKALRSGRPFDAVILDLTIPGGMGGKETIQKLLEIDAKAKVIVSSGYSNDPIMADYKAYGFSGVVSKPYTIHQLSEAVRKIIEG
jgi:DNA-binding NarL/FixJ family response regulator